MRPAIARALAGSVLAAGALAGCATASHPAANPAATQSTANQSAADQSTATLSATAAAQDQACSEQAAWDRRGQAALKALYADTGALSADAAAGNAPAVTKAGRKLASDAIAAAALPLPPVDPASWKALTADYAAAGTAIAGGDASGAVPQLESGNGAISAFSAAAGKCAT